MDTNDTVQTSNGLVSGQWVPMASWGRRVAASLIDQLIYLIAYLPYFIGWAVLVDASPGLAILATPSSADLGTLLLSSGLMLLGTVLGLVVFIWNRVLQQGRTGQSVGKSVLNLYLVSSRTGMPVGAGTSFVREIVHVLDGLLYLGYLWPLWDKQRQTWADKIVGTVVAHAVTVETPEPDDAEIPWAEAMVPSDGTDPSRRPGDDDTAGPGTFPRPLPQ